MNLIDRIDAARKRATPGPWIVDHDVNGVPSVFKDDASTGGIVYDAHYEHDAEFIATLDPETVGLMVAAIRASHELAWPGSSPAHRNARRALAPLFEEGAADE